MDLKEGMYVRTDNGLKLGKVIEKHKLTTKTWYELDTRIRLDNSELTKKKIKDNIIDLIEVGDYVNGYKVSFKGNDYKPFVQCDYPVEEGTTNHYRFYEETIFLIVTKEQFESMEYKVC